MPYKDIKKTEKGWVLVKPDGSYMKRNGSVVHYDTKAKAQHALKAIMAKES